jgi:4-aminobutyrate aminotransferase-like enzyme
MYYKEPVALVKGEGEHVWDDAGNKYLDAFGGVLTVSVGHANPEINKAWIDQVNSIAHTSTLYANQPQSDLAEKLAEISPGELKKSFFTSSGTEADDTAIMAAKLATGRGEIVVLRHSYSGRSATALSSVGHSSWRPLPSQVAGIVHARAPYCYRCPWKMTPENCGAACAEDVKDVIETTTTGEIAAFMAEPIMGVGGFIVPPKGYFERVEEITRQHGGLFISDEVQTGWGRTGEHFWGIQAHGVRPDLMTFAKGLGNGLAIGGVVGRPELVDSVSANSISTFGGNPLVTAGALANLKYLLDHDLQHNARIQGERLKNGLQQLAGKYGIVGEVRGKGLMIGLTLVVNGRPSAQAATRVMAQAQQRGLLIGKGGLAGNALRIAPPLSVTAAEIDEALDILTTSIEATDAGAGE